MSIWQTDVTALLDAYAAGQLTPVQAVESMLARIESLNPTLNAYTAMNDLGLSEAVAATARWRVGAPNGPLDGVPVSWKDLFDTAGIATEAGTVELTRRLGALTEPFVTDFAPRAGIDPARAARVPETMTTLAAAAGIVAACARSGCDAACSGASRCANCRCATARPTSHARCRFRRTTAWSCGSPRRSAR